MKPYVGTKRINAKPMTRLAYNQFRGWELPADENGSDEGYLVEYIDGGEANTAQYKGYVSWSPKAVFEQAYKSTDSLTYAHAHDALMYGLHAARKGWNGKGQYVFVMNLGEQRSWTGKEELRTGSCLALRNAQGVVQPGWVPSQGDMFASDWYIIEVEKRIPTQNTLSFHNSLVKSILEMILLAVEKDANASKPKYTLSIKTEVYLSITYQQLLKTELEKHRIYIPNDAHCGKEVDGKYEYTVFYQVW